MQKAHGKNQQLRWGRKRRLGEEAGIKQYTAYPGKPALLAARRLLQIEYVVYNHLQTLASLLVGLLAFRLLHAFRPLAMWQCILSALI